MLAVRDWVRRRPYTVSLAAFFVAWYSLQLSVFHMVSEDAARWLFYFEKPPKVGSTGMLFAPLSHDLYTLTHIGSNVVMLLIVGGVAEPYIGKDRILVIVIGLGYMGIYLANITVLVHKMWVVAGASGGILALWAYTGLRLRHLAFEHMGDGVTWSRRGVETVVAMALLIGTPVFLVHQTMWIAQPHSGHVIGLLLGCLYYGVEAYFGDLKKVQRGGIPHGR